MFDSTQQDLFNNVRSDFGTKINLEPGGNSYLFFNLLSKEVDVANQYGIEQLNKFSVFSSQKNYLNGLGFLNNYRRPYEQFSFSAKIHAPASTSIDPGLQIGFINENDETLLFITQSSYTTGSDGSVDADFFYVGINQTLDTIPKSTSFVLYPDSGGAGGGLVTEVVSNDESIPSFISDEEYRYGIETIRQSSSFGSYGLIELSVKNLSVVSDCKVYWGTDPDAPTVISGKVDPYNLDYGDMLIIVKWSVDSVPSISPPFYPAVDLIIAKTISKIFNYLNKFYGALATGKREIPIVTSAGNTLNVIYYEAIKTTLDIVLNISSSSPRANDSIKQKLENDIQEYIDNIPIKGTLYFSEISKMANNYSLISVSMAINASTNVLEFSASPDEYYELSTFSLSYTS